MIDKLEEAKTLFYKTSGSNNLETYVSTHNRFTTYMVLICSDSNKDQIHKMPYRYSPPDEIEIVMGFNYLNLFKPNEHREDYHIRKPKDEIFLIEIEVEKYIYLGKNLVSFETNDKIVKFSSDLRFNDIKNPNC